MSRIPANDVPPDILADDAEDETPVAETSSDVDLDLEASPGSVRAGVEVIRRVRLDAAELARRLSHDRCQGRGALHRQGEVAEGARRLLCARRGPFEPPRPDDRRHRRDGVRHHRDRSRGAAPRGEPDQAAAGRATTCSCGTTSRCPTSCSPADHEAPQVVKHRGARNRPGSYFGPFANVWAVNRTINALQRAFLLRSCNDSYYDNRTRPCLLFQIKRCSGPCTQEIAIPRIPRRSSRRRAPSCRASRTP